MSTKNSQRWGRLFLLTLLSFTFSLLVSGTSMEVLAAKATGTVKNPILNVRSTASTGSSILCKLTKGTTVTVLDDTIGTDNLKWYQISFSYNGASKEGYVRGDLIVLSGSAADNSGSSSGSTSSKYVQPNVAIVRTYASTNGDIRYRLTKGTQVTVLSSKTGTDDGKTWYKISFTANGSAIQGYIRGDLLTDTNPGSSASSSNTTDVSGTRYINENIVRVRTYASTNADIRTRLSKGTSVSLISSKTGDDGQLWYKVSYSNNGYQQTGYIRSDMLTGENSSASTGGSNTSGSDTSSSLANTSATIKGTVVNIRTYASTEGDIRAKLSQGTTVKILSEKKGDDGFTWYKISYSYNGSAMTGYVRSDLVITESASGSSSSSSGSSSGSSSSGSNSGGVAQVRTYASPYADIRATLQNGTKVTLLLEKTGEDGQLWTKISFTQNGTKMEGYIPSSLLK